MRDNFRSMSTDELWTFHEQIAATLVARIAAGKEMFENRLRSLNRPLGCADKTLSRRPYPAVLRTSRRKPGQVAANSLAGSEHS